MAGKYTVRRDGPVLRDAGKNRAGKPDGRALCSTSSCFLHAGKSMEMGPARRRRRLTTTLLKTSCYKTDQQFEALPDTDLPLPRDPATDVDTTGNGIIHPAVMQGSTRTKERRHFETAAPPV